MSSNCNKCQKIFKSVKYLLTHQTKYPNCEFGKYHCKKCNFNTNKKYNYTQHLKAKIHLINHNICQICLKEFRDKYNYDRHIKRKIECNISNKPDSNSKIINNETNNINHGQINNGINVIVNHTGNTPIDMNEILKIEPHLYKGAMHNQLKNIKSSNTKPFLDPIPVTSFNDHILELLNNDNHEYIFKCILDADEVDLEDTLIDKVNNKISLMRKNNLLKNIYPIKDLTRINSSKQYTFKYKLTFTPELLTVEELDNHSEDIKSWKEENQKVINEYIINLIKEALIKTYMDPKNRSTHSLCELNNSVYCKLDNSKLRLLTNEVFAELFKSRNQIDNLVYANFNKYMIEEIEYDLNILYDIIKCELEKLLDVY